MDSIDLNLQSAWHAVAEKCRQDPAEALRRMRRRFGKTVFRPVRPWCLCIRAADTRINDHTAIIEPTRFEAYQEAQPLEHDVTLDGAIIRKLTKPVFIPWPGVPMWRAADMLGMSPEAVWRWKDQGYLAVSSHANSRMFSRNCKPIPVVFTPTALDPNHPAGRPPDRVWGTLWQGHWSKFPENYEQTIRRVPRYRMWKGQSYFRGWDWECPGLVAEASANQDGTTEQTEEHSGWHGHPARANHAGRMPAPPSCGRRCKYLFAPLPVWTLAKSSDDRGVRLPMPPTPECGLAGEWEPGLSEFGTGVAGLHIQAEIGRGRRTFACKHCWNIHCITLSNHTGWNDFVTHISGGLLYGHEVERPLAEAPYQRKRAFAPRERRKAEGNRQKISAG